MAGRANEQSVLTIGAGSVGEGQVVFYYSPNKGWDRGSFRGFGRQPPHAPLQHHSGTHCGTKDPANNANGRPVIVKNKEGETFELAVRDVYIPLADTLASKPPSDLLALPELHHSVLVHAIRERHSHDVCYTFLGSLLVSLNPFSYTIPHYASSMIDKYLAKAPNPNIHEGADELHPHPWSIAHRVFFEMRQNRRNHSIIISGESGSGKTEQCKIVMHYLCCLSADLTGVERPPHPQQAHMGGGAAAKSGGGSGPMEKSAISILIDKVNASNPIMEAFGNAKTARNDNSSRFGKLTEIQFSSTGEIGGMRISPFLLEKSRCVTAAAEERCYHSFYQLMAGASDTMKADLKLKSVRDFPMLSRGGSVQVSGVNDAKEFELTCEAFIQMGFSKEERDFVWRVVAAVLHLSTVTFVGQQPDTSSSNKDAKPSAGFASSARAMFEQKNNENNSGRGPPIRSSASPLNVKEDPASQLPAVLSPASVPTVEFICEKLLKIETKEFMRLLTISTALVKGEEVIKTLTRLKANEQRDTLCKHLYTSLFYWIVDKINSSTMPSDTSSFVSANSISLLDIFGFEDFVTGNSLEQLCINLANESLQRHYSKHVFERDSEEIASEGVTCEMAKFVDNEPCVQLIMGAKNSLFSMLEDSNTLDLDRDKADPNVKYLEKITTKHKPDFHTSKPSSSKSLMDRDCNTLSTPSDFFARAKLDSDAFTVKHFASDVKYRVECFIEKNIDSLRDTMKAILHNSDESLVQDMLIVGAAQEAGGSGSGGADPASPLSPRTPSLPGGRGGAVGGRIGRPVGVVAQFRNSLKELLSTLDNTQPNWIRCIRPHPKKAAKLFDPKSVLEQLIATGVLETITQRQRNFPFRIEIEQFVHRFGVICAGTSAFKRMSRSGLHEKAQAILTAASLGTRGGAQVGKTKVFLRTENLNKLERVRQEKVSIQANILTKFATSFVSRRIRRELHVEFASRRIQKWYRRWKYVKKLIKEFLAELVKRKRERDEEERQALMETENKERALLGTLEKTDRQPYAHDHKRELVPLLKAATDHLVRVEPSFRDKAVRLEREERVNMMHFLSNDKKEAIKKYKLRVEEERLAFERAEEELAQEVNETRSAVRREEKAERKEELEDYWEPIHAEIIKLAKRIRTFNSHRDHMIEKLQEDMEREKQRIIDSEKRRIASEARLWTTLAGPEAAQRDVERLKALGLTDKEVEEEMKRFFKSGAPSKMMMSSATSTTSTTRTTGGGGGGITSQVAALRNSSGSSSSVAAAAARAAPLTKVTHLDYAMHVRAEYERSIEAGKASVLPSASTFDATKVAIAGGHVPGVTTRSGISGGGDGNFSAMLHHHPPKPQTPLDTARISNKARDYAKFVKALKEGSQAPTARYHDPESRKMTKSGGNLRVNTATGNNETDDNNDDGSFYGSARSSPTYGSNTRGNDDDEYPSSPTSLVSPKKVAFSHNAGFVVRRI